MTSNVRALVVAHGKLADGLVSAVEVIAGRGEVFRALSNQGLSGADVVAMLTTALDETGAQVIFTDLPAGSCTLAARRVQRERPGVKIVVGVNLPMLLEFAVRDTATDGDLAAAAERAREHIRVVAGDHVR